MWPRRTGFVTLGHQILPGETFDGLFHLPHAAPSLLRIILRCPMTSHHHQPTLKMSPARGVGRGLRASNSPRPQTTAPTVCPRIHHPAIQLPKPNLIATKPSKPLSCESCERQNLIFQRSHNRSNSSKPSLQSPT